MYMLYEGMYSELVCLDLELHQRIAAGRPCECVCVCVCVLCVLCCVCVFGLWVLCTM